MTVRVVAPSYPDLAHSIYADRSRVHPSKGFSRVRRGLYFAHDGERVRELREEALFLADDTVVIVPRASMGYDLKLFTPEDYVQEISTNRGIRPAKNLYKPLERLTPEEFQTFVTYSCILRRWYREILVKKTKVYTLFEALAESKRDFLESYYTLRSHVSAPELLASILTFLTRIDLYEDQKGELSKFYRKVIRRGKGQQMRVGRAAMELMRLPRWMDLDSKVVQFCLDLRGG